MTQRRKFTRYHFLAGTILIVLVFSVLGLVAYNNWIGISVGLNTTNPRDQIGPYEIITLTFSQAVRAKDVEKQLQMEPPVETKMEWANERTLRIIPVKPYNGTLTIRLPAGKIGANDDLMRLDAAWTLTVRKPSIVYINYAEPKIEIMVIPAAGGAARALTSTGGKVFDFSVSPSGDMIVYLADNTQKGADLWLVDRNGQNQHRLLDCGTDLCSSAAWSPDGKMIAYNRQLPGATEEDPRVRLWLINVETAENRPVFFSPQTVSSGALWSLDGNWLASYDSTMAKIRVTHLISHKEVLLPSHSDQPGSWSPDSNSLLYSDYTIDSQGNILKNALLAADLKTGNTNTLLTSNSDENNYRYGNPLWAPGGNLIALSMRSIRHEIPRLWVVQADKPDEAIMTAASGYSYDSYQWDMWGNALLIQQTSLTRAYLYEVAIWNKSNGYRVVGKDTLNPRWLP